MTRVGSAGAATGSRRTSAAGRVLLALAFSLALLLRIAVPAGWMIDPAVAGVHLVPCPAAGPVGVASATAPGHDAMVMSASMADHAMMAAHAKPHDHHHGHETGETCPFAMAAAAAVAPLPAVVAPPPGFAATAPRIVQIVGIGRGLAAPPPPATGPPLLA